MPDARADRIRRILVDRLPEEVLLPTTLRRAMITILATLLLLTAINFAAKWYLKNFPANHAYWLMNAKWELLGSMSEPADWLIVGDSSANQGVIPSVIEEQLGGQAVNLATTAGTTLLDDLWMLEEHIERFGPPKNVLVVHTVDVWHRDVEYVMLAKIPRPWGFWQSSPIYPHLNSDKWSQVLLARYIPLYGENTSILKAVTRGIESPETIFNNPYELGPGGYMPSLDAKPLGTQKDAEKLKSRFERQDLHVSKINRALLAEMVTLADEYNFDVYLVYGPLLEGVIQHEPVKKYLSRVDQTLTEMAGQSTNVHYVPMLAGFPAEQMQNADHVVHTAAQSYSQMLANEIEKMRGGTGSVNSP